MEPPSGLPWTRFPFARVGLLACGWWILKAPFSFVAVLDAAL